MFNNNKINIKKDDNKMDTHKTTDEKIVKKKIKHLVFNGGGPTGFITYGAAKQLNISGIWNLEDIETMYGCSIGGCLSFILSLGYEWEWLDDYFIKRPWMNILKININSIISSFDEKGFLDETFFINVMEPLLLGKNLDKNITLKEFYEWNKKEIHVYSTNINSPNFEKIDISYKTHPDLCVIRAIYISCSYPILFKPFCVDDFCYIDGGLLNNYPLNDCIKQTNCDTDEILAFKNNYTSKKYNITEKSTIFDFIYALIKKMKDEIISDNKQINIKNTVYSIIDNLSDISEWINIIESEQSRSKLIELGVQHANYFISYHNY